MYFKHTILYYKGIASNQVSGKWILCILLLLWDQRKSVSKTVLSSLIMYAYMNSDNCQTLCKIPLHSINLTHLILITFRNYVTSGAFHTWVLVGVHIFTVYRGFEATRPVLGGCLLWWLIDYDWQLLSTSAAKMGSVLLVFRAYNLDSLCVYWFPDGNFKTVSTLCHDVRFWK